MELAPLYTASNCTFCSPLQWALSVFWRIPQDDTDWYPELATALEADGVRLLSHRYGAGGMSQFSLSTKPHLAPTTIVQRVKGRLQYLVRDRVPKALRRNYSLRSFGKVKRSTVEQYVASQLDHHRLADSRVQERFTRYQIHRQEVDLSRPRQGSHGVYWYNLHVVLVHCERWREVREDVLGRVQAMIIGACETKGWLLSRAGILADHVHIVLGCRPDVAPLDVGLSFLNNLAYAHGMRPVFQFGGYLGTVGEYDRGAVVAQEAERQ